MLVIVAPSQPSLLVASLVVNLTPFARRSFGYWKTQKDYETNQAPIKGSSIEVSRCEVSEVNTDKYPGQFPFKVSVMVEDEVKELMLMAATSEGRQGWINLIKMSSGSTQSEAAVL